MNSMHYQGGATLIVSLIMLVLMTLLAVTSFNLGKGSLQTVGNMQHRSEAMAAAQETMEQIISSTNFFITPAAIIPATSTCPVNTRCIDSNGDGTPDVTVTVATPVCVKAAVIPNDQIDVNDPNVNACSKPGTDSGCSNTLWEVTVSAVDATTQAQYSITQGVAVPVNTNDIAIACP